MHCIQASAVLIIKIKYHRTVFACIKSIADFIILIFIGAGYKSKKRTNTNYGKNKKYFFIFSFHVFLPFGMGAARRRTRIVHYTAKRRSGKAIFRTFSAGNKKAGCAPAPSPSVFYKTFTQR